MSETQEQKNREFVDGLRRLADFYEDHYDLFLPRMELSVYDCQTKEDAAVVMRSLGSCEKSTERDGLYDLIKRFGPIELRFVFLRDKVCERVQTGVKIIPEHTIPAQAEQIILEQEIPVYEWRCPDSILAGKEGAP